MRTTLRLPGARSAKISETAKELIGIELVTWQRRTDNKWLAQVRTTNSNRVTRKVAEAPRERSVTELSGTLDYIDDDGVNTAVVNVP